MTMIPNTTPADVDAFLDALSYVELQSLIDKALKKQVRLKKEGAQALAAQFADACLEEFGMSPEELLEVARTSARGRKRKIKSDADTGEAVEAATPEVH